MKVIGKDIGTTLDDMYTAIERRVRIETEREIRIEPFEGGSFSNVTWNEPDTVLIQVHNGVPTHALPHIFGVALQHVRQRLDLYPTVQPGPQDVDGAALIRVALRELVLAPEAEKHLEPLRLDSDWETEQRHEALKQMLKDAPDDWNTPGSIGHVFASLQYARFSIDHPPEMWSALQRAFDERFAHARGTGENVHRVVVHHGWNTPAACLDALVGVRDMLGLQPVAVVEDRRTGRTY